MPLLHLQVFNSWNNLKNFPFYYFKVLRLSTSKFLEKGSIVLIILHILVLFAIKTKTWCVCITIIFDWEVSRIQFPKLRSPTIVQIVDCVILVWEFEFLTLSQWENEWFFCMIYLLRRHLWLSPRYRSIAAYDFVVLR